LGVEATKLFSPAAEVRQITLPLMTRAEIDAVAEKLVIGQAIERPAGSDPVSIKLRDLLEAPG